MNKNQKNKMKRLTLNESLKSFEEFSNELGSIMKDSVTTENETGSITPGTSTDVASEIDTILTKLKDLEDNMNESLGDYYMGLDEKDDGSMKKLKDFMIVAPKVRKLQKKANKIRLNKVDLDFAVLNAPSAKKKTMQGKASDLGKNIDDLEKSIDLYQNQNGSTYSQKVKNMTRIEGKLGAIKRKTGLSDDPDQKSNLKQQVIKLNQDYKDEVEAAKELQSEGPSKEEMAKEKFKQQKDALIKQGFKQGEGSEGSDKKTIKDPEGNPVVFHKPEVETGGIGTQTSGYNESHIDGSGRQTPII